MLRFAPSPTGDMHIGNLRVALFNYLMAKRRNEAFLLRIEDTDTARNIEGKDLEIIELLHFFGLSHDQMVYQSGNLKFHRELAEKLIREDKAFRCYCDEATLESKREAAKTSGEPYRYDGACESRSDTPDAPSVIRLKKPQSTITFTDLIKGTLSFAPKEVDSFIILRQDGTPTYNFACAADDMLYDISLIIRGEDHVSNTPKQIHIHQMLDYTKPLAYAHLPIILNASGKKMSKRDDESSVKWLLEEGYLPEAILNYLALMGNKPPQEFFSLSEALEWFSLDTLSKAPAKFDLDKLRFLNRAHLKRLPSERLASFIGYKGASFGDLAKCYLEEASTLGELKPKIDAIFAPKCAPAEMEAPFLALRSAAPSCIRDDFESFKTSLMEATGLKGKQFFKPLRLLLTGAEHGPELSDLYPLLIPHFKEILR